MVINSIRGIDDAWQKISHNYKELTLIIHRQEKQIMFLETKALNLSMFYVASQLFIFLSNSNPSPDQCRNWWKPFFISLTIAVAFGMNFTTTIFKYIGTKYGQDRNFIDLGENYLQMVYLERHGTKDKNKEAVLELDMPEASVVREPDMFVVYQRYAYLGVIASALVAYTVLVLLTCRCAETVQSVTNG